jgi:hypothetical protein
MKSFASRVSLVVTGVVLLSVALALANVHRAEECRPSDCLAPRTPSVAMAGSPAPTLAPPQKVVMVQIETDKSDIEVSWAENLSSHGLD